LNFLSAIILIGIMQGFALFIIFFYKKPKGYLFLNLILCALLIQQIETLLIVSGGMVFTLHILNISTPFAFILGPSIWGYSEYVIFNQRNFRRLFLHFIPFLFYFLYSFFGFLQPLEIKHYTYLKRIQPGLDIASPVRPFEADPWDIQGFIVVELICLHIIIYGIMGLIRISRIDVNTKEKVSYSWVRLLNFLLICAGTILLLSEGGLVQGYKLYEPPLPHYFPQFFNMLSLYGITIYLLLNPRLFGIGKEYKNSSLTEDIRKYKLDKIISLLYTEKIYLSNSFSLRELSVKTGITSNHITEVLNRELGMSFYDLTHQYRIEEAKRLIGEKGELKLEQLALNLGYNSKSTFFNAFKKLTSLTPNEYRKSLED